MRIIASITSYPARIKNVGKSIYLLLYKQTVPPDEIHVWLAEPEFPNKENDFPDDLKIVSNIKCVFIHWLPKNTYCHKRHEIFKIEKNADACVFFFDEDVQYDKNLIEIVMKKHEEFPNAIINYEHYSLHLYSGRKILYKNATDYSKPRFDIRWCGQSMIPANIYPIESLTDKNADIRDKTCPICDESWLTPWIVYKNIPILCMHFGWGNDIDKTINKKNGLCSLTHKKESNGYEKRDNWLYDVLEKYEPLKKKYKELFGYGK